MEQVEKCLSLGAPPASPIDVCVGPRDREAGRRDDGGDHGDGEGGEDCDDFKTARVGRRLERGGQYEEGLCD